MVYPWWRAYVASFSASVPLGWTVTRDEQEGLVFSTISKGADVKVRTSISKHSDKLDLCACVCVFFW